LAVLAGLLLAPGTAMAELPTDGELAVSEIRRRIENRDCGGAVERLKQGLAASQGEVALMGGSMYEHGACVRRDWQRAVPLYARAFEQGQAEGAERLAAGYADPANGPDAAAAIWWAWRGRTFNAPDCGVDGAAPRDPDRLVAEMAKWPAARLAGCTYIAGVMSTISAELKYPELARSWAVGGDVWLRFHPAAPRFELQRGESRDYQLIGAYYTDRLRDRKSKAVATGFEKALGDIADRALRRYPHPAGIPEDTLVQVRYSFYIK
jgi:hypothetical protein